MYVVFQLKNKEFCIQELTMAGIPKTDIKDKLVGPKISLAYDFDLEKLFWADEGAGRIESISFIGSLRIKLSYIYIYICLIFATKKL